MDFTTDAPTQMSYYDKFNFRHKNTNNNLIIQIFLNFFFAPIFHKKYQVNPIAEKRTLLSQGLLSFVRH